MGQAMGPHNTLSIFLWCNQGDDRALLTCCSQGYGGGSHVKGPTCLPLTSSLLAADLGSSIGRKPWPAWLVTSSSDVAHL